MPAPDPQQADDGFYFDLDSPRCYLVAEQILEALPGPLEWRPVLASRLGAGDAKDDGEHARDGDELREEVAAEATRLGLQPLRWPPADGAGSERAMLAATYAKSIGRTVPFAQAAFRQAFAGGQDLGRTEPVLIAGAACEIHPRALLRALESRMVQMQLASATEAAIRAGIRRLPAIVRHGCLFSGGNALEQARASLALPPAREACPS